MQVDNTRIQNVKYRKLQIFYFKRCNLLLKRIEQIAKRLSILINEKALIFVSKFTIASIVKAPVAMQTAYACGPR